LEGKVKMNLCLIKHCAMETCGTVEVELLAFLTSALRGVEWSLSRPDRFTAQEKVPNLDAADNGNLFALTGFYSFLVFSWCGVRLSPLATSATNWPIVPAPDDE
jgi:hypothetical protein